MEIPLVIGCMKHQYYPVGKIHLAMHNLVLFFLALLAIPDRNATFLVLMV